MMTSWNAAGLASPACQRFQVEHHAARKLFREAREAEAFVEGRGGLVDRVGHEQTERHRAILRELEGQPEGLFEQVPAETLTLHPLVDGETREQHGRNRETG